MYAWKKRTSLTVLMASAASPGYGDGHGDASWRLMPDPTVRRHGRGLRWQ